MKEEHLKFYYKLFLHMKEKIIYLKLNKIKNSFYQSIIQI